MSLFSEGCGCPANFEFPSIAETCGGGASLVFLSLLEQFINGRCDLTDPCNRVKNVDRFEPEYDFIVVGGGTGGSVIASRLSENPNWKVLLIEAGEDEPNALSVPSLLGSFWGNPHYDWNYKTEPQSNACLAEEDQKCAWTRAKVLGGCSVFNGMMYMRGLKSDYDNWAKQGANGWAWSDVFPYFLKSEDNREIGRVDSRYHSRGGLMPVQRFADQPEIAFDLMKAADEIGFGTSEDLNGEKITGLTIAQTMNLNGSRMSTARAFLRPASSRKNLHVTLNSTATKILFNEATKTATGVEFIKNGAKFTAKAKKEVILTSGTVNSPQLLLLSGVGPKEDLRKHGIKVIHDLPGVGQNLHNHVATFMNFYLTKQKAYNHLDWVSVVQYMTQRKGKMASTGLAQVTAILNSKFADPSGERPDVQLFFGGYLASCSRTGEHHEEPHPDNPDEKEVLSISPVVLHPKSRGYLTLKSKNPLHYPLIYPNYLNEPEDVETLIEGMKLVNKFLDSKIMQEKYGIQPDISVFPGCADAGPHGSDEYLRCIVKHITGPENHQVGTCKIGNSSDPFAVVDPELKVYGVKGLRVMDASVMPTVPSSNTASPVIMIAERGADFISKTWKSSSQSPSLSDRFGVSDNAPNKKNDQQPNNNDYRNPQNAQNSHNHYHRPSTQWYHDPQWHKEHNIPLPQHQRHSWQSTVKNGQAVAA